MSNVLVLLFYVWLFAAVAILIHRRYTTGSFRPSPESSDGAAARSSIADIDFGAPPASAAETDGDARGDRPEDPWAARAIEPTAVITGGPSSLAEALEGVHMPCELIPIVADVGATGGLDPCHVAFSTVGHDLSDVAGALTEELGKLGYELTPTDGRSFDAVRDDCRVSLTMRSSTLDSPTLMSDHYPTVAADSLVLEMRLH